MTSTPLVCKCGNTTFRVEWDGTYWVAICENLECKDRRNYLTHNDDEEEERLEKMHK